MKKIANALIFLLVCVGTVCAQDENSELRPVKVKGVLIMSVGYEDGLNADLNIGFWTLKPLWKGGIPMGFMVGAKEYAEIIPPTAYKLGRVDRHDTFTGTVLAEIAMVKKKLLISPYLCFGKHYVETGFRTNYLFGNCAPGLTVSIDSVDPCTFAFNITVFFSQDD